MPSEYIGFLSKLDQLSALQRDEMEALTDDEFGVLMLLCQNLRRSDSEQMRRLAGFAMLGMGVAANAAVRTEDR